MTVVMLYLDDVPVVYRTMFTIPNIVVMNMMACRVFRNTRLGDFQQALVVDFNIVTILSREGRNDRNGLRSTATIPLGPIHFRNEDERPKTDQSGISIDVSIQSEHHIDEKSGVGSQHGHG